MHYVLRFTLCITAIVQKARAAMNEFWQKRSANSMLQSNSVKLCGPTTTAAAAADAVAGAVAATAAAATETHRNRNT